MSEVNLGIATRSPADIQFNELPGGLFLGARQGVSTDMTGRVSRVGPRAEGTGCSQRIAFPVEGLARGGASKGALLAGASRSQCSPAAWAGRPGS